MSSFFNFLYGIILIIIWIVAAGFITEASIKLYSSRNKDDDLNKAYWYTFWTSVVIWTLVALFILLIIFGASGIALLFGGGAEAAISAQQAEALGIEPSSLISQGISWFTIIFLIVALALTTTTGILAAIAAQAIKNSTHFNPQDANLNKAYNDCVIAAVMSLVASGLLVVGVIIYIIVGVVNANKVKKAKAELQKEMQEEADQEYLEELQAKAAEQKKQELINALLEKQIQQAQVAQPVVQQPIVQTVPQPVQPTLQPIVQQPIVQTVPQSTFQTVPQTAPQPVVQQIPQSTLQYQYVPIQRPTMPTQYVRE
jgi:hypothetical protein